MIKDVLDFVIVGLTMFICIGIVWTDIKIRLEKREKKKGD